MKNKECLFLSDYSAVSKVKDNFLLHSDKSVSQQKVFLLLSFQCVGGVRGLGRTQVIEAPQDEKQT